MSPIAPVMEPHQWVSMNRHTPEGLKMCPTTGRAEVAMLSAQDNELITQTSKSTPMGELFRRFWLPVLLPEELPEPDCPQIRIKVMGEYLVAFRDTNGNVGLVEAF